MAILALHNPQPYMDPFSGLDYDATLKAFATRKGRSRAVITSAVRAQVKKKVREGLNNKEIAAALGISEQSVIVIKRQYALQRVHVYKDPKRRTKRPLPWLPV